MNRFTSPIVPSLALVALLGAALPAADTVVSIRQGETRVQLELALDELAVTGPGAEVRRVQAVDRAGLAGAARAMAAQPGAPEVLAVAYPPGAARTPENRRIITREVAFQVGVGIDAAAVAAAHGVADLRPAEVGERIWIGRVVDTAPAASVGAADRLAQAAGVVWAEPQLKVRAVRRADPVDPLLADQWHLENPYAPLTTDINASAAWAMATGAGINVAVADDGVQYSHPDLVARARTDLDIDFVDGDLDASAPDSDDEANHGTFVSGCAVASANGVGGVGVAHGAGLVGIRILGGDVTDAQLGSAMSHQARSRLPVNQIMVSNNSWGWSTDNTQFATLGSMMAAGLDTALAEGRNGRGIVFCWASGNSGDEDDTANHDGLLNHRVIPVGSVNIYGRRSYYSEYGSNLHIVAPGGEDGTGGIVSTDRVGAAGYTIDDYTSIYDGLQGTSFATPLVAGASALMLEVNPQLTWREVQHVLAATARITDPDSLGWRTNGAGYRINDEYGFGLLDAGAACALAARWPALPAAAPTIDVGGFVGPRQMPALGTETWSPTVAAGSDFVVETVDLTVNIHHLVRGEVRFEVQSPQGTVSHIRRRVGDDGSNFDVTFPGIRQHWGERADGTWTVRMVDEVDGNAGTVNSVRLRLRGFRAPGVPAILAVAPAVAERPGVDVPVTITGDKLSRDGAGVLLTQLWVGGTRVDVQQLPDDKLSAVIPAALTAAADGSLDLRLVNPAIHIGPWSGADLSLSHGGTSATAAFRVNRPPTIPGGDRLVAMSEDAAPTPFSVSLSAADADAGDPLAWTLAEAPANGIAQVQGTGSVPVVGYTPAADWNGTDRFVVRVMDAAGTAATAAITVGVGAVNDPPRFRAGSAVAATGTGAQNRSLWATGIHPGGGADEAGQTVSFQVTGIPSGVFAAGPAVDAAGTLSFTLLPGAPLGSHAMQVRAVDSAAGQSPAATLTVIVAASADTTAPEAPVGLQVVSQPATGALPVIAGTAEAGATVHLWAGDDLLGATAADPDGSWSWSATDAWADGLYEVTATAEDAAGNRSGRSAVLPVRVGNAPPRFQGGGGLTGDEDTLISLDLVAVDDEGGALTWAIDTLPVHGSALLVDNGSGRQLRFQPDADWSGSDALVVSVTDPVGASATRTVAILVAAVDDPPVLVAPSALALTEDDAGRTIAVTATDIDTPGSGLSLAAQSLQPTLVAPTGIEITGGAGTWTVRIRPVADRFGTGTVRLLASDGTTIRSVDVTIAVSPVNDRPVLVAAPSLPVVVAAGSPVAATAAEWSDAVDGPGLPAVSRIWERRTGTGPAAAIAGATAITYTPGVEDLDRWLRMVETATDAGGLSATAATAWVRVPAPSGVRRWVVLDAVPGRAWVVVDPDLEAFPRASGMEVGPSIPGEPVTLGLMPTGGN